MDKLQVSQQIIIPEKEFWEKEKERGRIVPTVNYRQHKDETLGIAVQKQFFVWDQLIASSFNSNSAARLPRDLAAHALWYYYTTARHSFERAERNLVLEGQPDQPFDPRQLFRSVAGIYGVSPKEMGRYWSVVDQQRIALGLSKNADLPERFKFRE